MTKQIINVGQTPNDKTGDTLRAAFNKINANFTELFDTDSVTQYRLGDDTQFVRIELDGMGVPTGGITIQSGYDTTMPVYIKGGNASDGGVGGNVVIEAGAPPLAGRLYHGTVGDIEMSANNITIDSLGNVTTFATNQNGTGYVTFPAQDGGYIAIQGVELTGTNGLVLTAENGSVYLTTNPSAPTRQWWEFDTLGTINSPHIFPVTFTAHLDPDHLYPNAGPGVQPFVGDPWYYDITLRATADGQTEIICNTNLVWTQDVYLQDWVFHFTEADHGIPNYTLSVSLHRVDIGNGNWGGELSFSISPQFPPTIKSRGAIKLRADTKNFTLGADGVIYLPTGGDIKRDGASVLGGGGASTGDIGFIGAAIYNIDGVTVENADLSHQATAALVIPANLSTSSVELNNTYGSITIGTGSSGTIDNTWTFGDNGKLTVPGEIWAKSGDNIQSLTFSSNGTDTSAYIKVDGGENSVFSANGSIYLRAFGNDRLSISYTDTTLQAQQALNLRSAGGDFSWALDADGKLNLPNAGGYGYIQTTGSIDLNANGNHWLFSTDGSLNLPSGGIIKDHAGHDIRDISQLKFDDSRRITMGGNGASVVFWRDFNNGYASGEIYADSARGFGLGDLSGGGVSISGYNGNKWTFDVNGKLFLAGDIYARTNNQVGNYVNALPWSNIGSGAPQHYVFYGTNPAIQIAQGYGDLTGYTMGLDAGGFTTTITGMDPNIGGFITADPLPNNNLSLTFFLQSPNYAPANAQNLNINTGFLGSNKTWTFGTNGSLTFPNATQQTTAYQTTTPPGSSKGVSGNKAGMVAFDNSNFYYCKQDYTNGAADIWVKTAWTSTSW